MTATIDASLKTILVATDFSVSAEKAEVYASALARQFDCKITLVHVVDLSAAFKSPDAGLGIDIFRRSVKEKLTNAKERMGASGVQVEATLIEGLDTAGEILQAASDGAADLVVSGTRGYGGLARLALGSVAEHLIYHAACPLFTVGPHVRRARAPENFKQIVCATDFSPAAASAVKFAVAFAQHCGAHVFLCHVLPRPRGGAHLDVQQMTEKFKAELQAQIPDIAREWCEPECVVDHGYAADGILLLAQRVIADLIVLGTHAASHWFTNPKTGIAFAVIRAAECPVLTVRG